MNVYPFIEAEQAGGGNVHRACTLLKVSQSAYYAHRAAMPTDRARQDADLAARVVAIHDESKGTYGAPRVHTELRAQAIGIPANASPGCYDRKDVRDVHRRGGAPPPSPIPPRPSSRT